MKLFKKISSLFKKKKIKKEIEAFEKVKREVGPDIIPPLPKGTIIKQVRTNVISPWGPRDFRVGPT